MTVTRVTLVLRNNTMKYMRSNSLTNYTRTTNTTNAMRTIRTNTTNYIPEQNNCGDASLYGDENNKDRKKDRDNWQV